MDFPIYPINHLPDFVVIQYCTCYAIQIWVSKKNWSLYTITLSFYISRILLFLPNTFCVNWNAIYVHSFQFYLTKPSWCLVTTAVGVHKLRAMMTSVLRTLENTLNKYLWRISEQGMICQLGVKHKTNFTVTKTIYLRIHKNKHWYDRDFF
jgi:hypothetical protein